MNLTPAESAAFLATPVGQAGALTARAIWEAAQMWSPTTLRHALNRMARDGMIHKTVDPDAISGIRAWYWRDA